MNYIYTILPSLLEGLKITIIIFSLTVIFSIPLGIMVALCSVSKIRFLKIPSELYVWVMRGTPLLLQLIIIFFGLPFIGITLQRFSSALIAFTLNYGAYLGEIFRAGINDIDKGQFEACQTLGFSRLFIIKRIIIPQMFKKILPSLGNEIITLLKDTSLVYAVGLGELLRAGKIASNRDASLFPLFLVCIIYLILIAVLTKILKNIERKYNYYN